MQELKRYHPYVISAYLLVLIIMTTTMNHPFFQGIFLVITWMMLLEFPEVTLRKQIRYNLVVILLVAFSNTLFQHRGILVICYVGSIPITGEAIGYGFCFGVMLATLINCGKLFSLLIHTDQLFYMINQVSPNAAVLCSLSLQQLSRMKQQYDDICYARRLLGSATTWWKRVVQQVEIVSSVLTWLMETGIDTSLSMKSRGFGSRKRTYYHRYPIALRDKRMLVMLCGILVLYLYGNQGIVFEWYPAIYQTLSLIQVACCMFAILLHSIIAFLLERKESAIWESIISESID